MVVPQQLLSHFGSEPGLLSAVDGRGVNALVIHMGRGTQSQRHTGTHLVQTALYQVLNLRVEGAHRAPERRLARHHAERAHVASLHRA
ncbi:hypothetical protein D9M68_701240 [compost metagenome]